jgi:uncharacterized protein YjbI with pentapeptide repeats
VKSRLIVQFAVLHFAIAVQILTGSWPSNAAELSARDVTQKLFAADRSAPLHLRNTNLSGLDLSGLNFKRADLSGANLYGADLSGSNLSGVRLVAARLDRATLIGANFDDADLTNASILRPNLFSDMGDPRVGPPATFRRVKMTNAHVNGRFDAVDFTDADLTGVFFGPRDPREEELISPMMSLAGADFSGAVLVGADLSLNMLEQARFVGADAQDANFRGARLGGADFTNANLPGVDFTGASLPGAILSGARGLNSAKGLPPSR